MDGIDFFYTIKEFAQKIRVHPNTVYRAIKDGRIQALRVGNGKKSSFRIANTEVTRMCAFDMNKIVQMIIEEEKGKQSGKPY